MSTPPSDTHERISVDGSRVKLTWFDNGDCAVVHIIRKNSGATFSISRAEAEALRAFLPAMQPDGNSA